MLEKLRRRAQITVDSAKRPGLHLSLRRLLAARRLCPSAITLQPSCLIPCGRVMPGSVHNLIKKGG